MDDQKLLEVLLRSEHEEEAASALDRAGHSINNDDVWYPLGQNPGNFSVVGNQQEDPAAAFVEKIVNSIDAVLMCECHRAGVDPESEAAPRSLRDAVHQFFKIHDGRLDNLDAHQQTKLADRIQVVTTGSKNAPCYCIIDRGEGQTPEQFPHTFLSTTQSSPKIRIDFVQGKFNAGGSGSLQFCGKHNMQLVVSRRQPHAPAVDGDESASQWGFTVVRRRRPRSGERSSVFVYLAPRGRIPRFLADKLMVLPALESSKNQPPDPYIRGLDYGTVVKLYNYQWPGRGIATPRSQA